MTAPLALDHLVYAVPDLAESMAEFEDRLGVALEIERADRPGLVASIKGPNGTLVLD